MHCSHKFMLYMYIPDNSNTVLTLITETMVNWSDEIHRYNTKHATKGSY